jgi:hypothetical protein
VPESDIVCGLFRALSVITTFPDREPVAVGVNVTLIVQLAVGASEAVEGGQLLPSAKSPGFAPAIAMLVIVSDVVPVFLSVTALAPLVVPTFCGLKLKLVALNDARGLITVALSVTVCGLL